MSDVPLTPPEGVPLFPGDSITVELLHPWRLFRRWLPSATVRFMVDTDGRLHVYHVPESE